MTAQSDRCDRCHALLPGKVLYDQTLKQWVCHWCWVKSPIPPPKPRRP